MIYESLFIKKNKKTVYQYFVRELDIKAVFHLTRQYVKTLYAFIKFI